MKSIRFHHTLFGAALAVASLCAQAQPFTGLFVYGDSLSDGGNAAALGAINPAQVITGNTYIPSAAYASETFSNGPVWVNSLATQLGVMGAGPSSTGGSNWALGGATSAGAVAQLNQFLTLTPSPSTSALYVIAVGGNDVRDAGTGGASTPAAFATNVTTMVSTLLGKGIPTKNIVVWNAPDVGKTPASIALGAGPGGTLLSTVFNGALNSALAAPSFAGLLRYDVFGQVNAIVALPGSFGLTNVTQACGAPSNACSGSVSTALFWDGIHPTTAGQSLIANGMFAVVAVPEPSSMLMLAVGICALFAWRRRA